MNLKPGDKVGLVHATNPSGRYVNVGTILWVGVRSRAHFHLGRMIRVEGVKGEFTNYENSLELLEASPFDVLEAIVTLEGWVADEPVCEVVAVLGACVECGPDFDLDGGWPKPARAPR